LVATLQPPSTTLSQLILIARAEALHVRADVRSCALHIGIRSLFKPQLTHINCNRFSTGFLLPQNDVVGTLTPEQFLVAFANYLGELWSIC
jgi:hypothetical protein